MRRECVIPSLPLVGARCPRLMNYLGNVHEHVSVTVAASATAAQVSAENGMSAPCQMYPNTGGKAITTIAAHAA